jgi:hypothetical protein
MNLSFSLSLSLSLSLSFFFNEFNLVFSVIDSSDDENALVNLRLHFEGTKVVSFFTVLCYAVLVCVL